MSPTPDVFPGWRLEHRYESLPDLPVLAEVDVLVVGGGAAGVAAATTAAEAGMQTLIVERYGFFGGAAVAGMSGTLCGMYMASDTRSDPEQVVTGFTERFRAALEVRGGVTGPQRYGKTWTVTHDPLMWREVADQLVEAAGARVLFHTSVSGVIMRGDACIGVVLESAAGQSIVLARCVIDASGDAAVVARAGLGYVFGDQGKIQNPTMFFRLGQVDMARFLDYWGEDTINPPKVSEAITLADEQHRYALPRKKIWIFPTTRPGELLVNATRLTSRDGHMMNVINPADITEAEIDGRKQVREYAAFLSACVPGCEASYVVDTGTQVGVRQTRSIVGVATLSNEDVLQCRKRPDGICRVPWPIELHAGEKPKLHWLLDDYYEVPYLALVPEHGENLIVAGRCLSAEHEALASARVTAQCFEYGRAAALAAVLSLQTTRRLRDIPGEEIRAAMRQLGSSL
ncbi:FAD-dependent oxidoreductase [Bordetella genomosp. 12]|uniref:FAD-dependent oxidoreductase n=1 Tax=Bordetella genomosp. 12 TaxID=463035 RepID=A0A261VMQ8_9BORD|nr:FAD-dependent oxidoreductase [Bordetella genomosp. 12]OZI74860.1 FAD-dependent oxidoreductase [Bordetella genomosp. 12]